MINIPTVTARIDLVQLKAYLYKYFEERQWERLDNKPTVFVKKGTKPISISDPRLFPVVSTGKLANSKCLIDARKTSYRSPSPAQRGQIARTRG